MIKICEHFYDADVFSLLGLRCVNEYISCNGMLMGGIYGNILFGSFVSQFFV